MRSRWKLSALMECHEELVDAVPLVELCGAFVLMEWHEGSRWTERSAPANLWTTRSTVDESLSVTDTHAASIVEVLFLTLPVLIRVPSQIMHSHGSRHILVLPLTVCHVCLLRLVSSPCHPCPPDAHATLTGIDFARDRPWEITI